MDTKADDIKVSLSPSTPPEHRRHNTLIVKGNGYFSMPPHTPVIFSEAGGRTLFRFLCRDAGGESERMLLQDTVPPWVVAVTVEVCMVFGSCVMIGVGWGGIIIKFAFSQDK